MFPLTVPYTNDPYSQAALPNSSPNACVLHCHRSREAVCNIFMKVFGMTQLGRKPVTYCMRGDHTNTKPSQLDSRNSISAHHITKG